MFHAKFMGVVATAIYHHRAPADSMRRMIDEDLFSMPVCLRYTVRVACAIKQYFFVTFYISHSTPSAALIGAFTHPVRSTKFCVALVQAEFLSLD